MAISDRLATSNFFMNSLFPPDLPGNSTNFTAANRRYCGGKARFCKERGRLSSDTASMMRCSMSADSAETVTNDYSRRAGFCVEVLGWLTLLRLDLLGLLLIKAGRGVRARERRWWKVAVAIWTLHLAVWLVIGAVAATIGGNIRLFGKSWTIPLGPWMVITFGLIGL